MANSPTAQEYGIRPQLGTQGTSHKALTANATIAPNQILTFDSDGKVGPAGAGALLVCGAAGDEVGYSSGDPVWVLWGNVRLNAGSPDILAGYALKCGASGAAIPLIDSNLAGDTIFTSAAGIAFTNQPANDGVTIVSADNGDTSDVTIIGTTNGADTVVVEVIALTGTTPANSVKTDWGKILAIKKEVTAGIVTVTETSGGQTIKAVAAAATSSGVEEVDKGTFNVAPVLVCSDTGTKQIGLQGTNSAGTTIYDSQALNGTSDVTMNSSFLTVTEIYTGDLEATRTASIKLGAEEDDDLKIGIALENQATATAKFWGRITR